VSDTIVIVDSSQVPEASRIDLRDGATLSLDDAPDLKCLVGFIVSLRDYVVSSCRICSGVTYVEASYELAEAKVVRHFRHKHSIYASLWRYEEDLIVHPIP